MTYDALGRVAEQRQGPRFWSFAYDARNRVRRGQGNLYAYVGSDPVIGRDPSRAEGR